MGHKVKKIVINFGEKLYNQLKKPNNRFNEYIPGLYANSPESGINYCVRYIDTNESNGSEDVKTGDNNNQRSVKPVIVLLHGSPGSIIDFQEFCLQFGQKYRLIIPEFPDFEFTRDSGYFWHSNEERTELIVSFLNKLSVNAVDCLVCHSGGNPVALQIIAGEFDGKLEVKSIVMITPPGFKWLSEFQIKHMRRMCHILSSGWRRKVYRFLIPDLIKPLFGVPKTLLKNCTKAELAAMTLVATMSGYDCGLLKKNYEILADKRVPTLFVMAEKDNLFAKWKFEKTLDYMSANREELFTYIGLNGEIESEAKVKDWIQVLDFRFGGHFCYIKYSKVFNTYFDRFFQSLDLQNGLKF